MHKLRMDAWWNSGIRFSMLIEWDEALLFIDENVKDDTFK